MDGNLCQIQSGPKTGDSIPLILFHDAGGTIFQYLLLEDLQRPVYGMANSRFDSGGNWDHGIREMGVVYAHKIRSVINSGKVILGGLFGPRSSSKHSMMRSFGLLSGAIGWSLGGCVALEVASRLAHLPQYSVEGIIMIDSVFPCRKVTDNYPRTLESVEAACPLPQELPSDRRTQSLHCLLSGHNMLREWSPPAFSHPARPLPPMVLLQATGKVYGESESTHYFDLVRDSGYLGWEEYTSAPFIARLEIPGHHFGVFDEAHVCPAPCLQVSHDPKTYIFCFQVPPYCRAAQECLFLAGEQK